MTIQQECTWIQIAPKSIYERVVELGEEILLFIVCNLTMTSLIIRVDDSLSNRLKRIVLQPFRIAEETGERKRYRNNPVIDTCRLTKQPVRVPIGPADDMLFNPLAPAPESQRENGARVGDVQHYSFNPFH